VCEKRIVRQSSSIRFDAEGVHRDAFTCAIPKLNWCPSGLLS